MKPVVADGRAYETIPHAVGDLHLRQRRQPLRQLGPCQPYAPGGQPSLQLVDQHHAEEADAGAPEVEGGPMVLCGIDDALRIVGEEHHFQIVGKRGVERWFRIPPGLYRDLFALRADGPFVFAAYNQQVRRFHAGNANWLAKIGDSFTPEHFGRWFYNRVKNWSEAAGRDNVYVHLFRKTTLQHARRGEDVNRQVASDACVSETVLMTNYVKETDEELRQKSNRTFRRILASLPPEIARRYGEGEADPPAQQQREAAVAAKNWDLAAALAARLSPGRRPDAR